MADTPEIPEQEQYKADNLREKLNQDFATVAIMAQVIADALEKDLDNVRKDTMELETRQTATETTLATTVVPQLLSLIPTVAAIQSAISFLTGAVKKAQETAEKAQASADKAQATADSKPGGPGNTGYTVIVKWAAPSGSNITGPINTSISSGGKNISKQLTSEQTSSLSGLSSGSIVTFAVDIGQDNTVQWKDPSADNPNLTGRSNFYKTYSGFKVPATSGTKTIIADIG